MRVACILYTPDVDVCYAAIRNLELIVSATASYSFYFNKVFIGKTLIILRFCEAI